MTISEIHDYILFILDKEQGGFVSDAEIDMALDRAQMTIFRHYLGNTRQYQPGRPVAPVTYGMTSVVNEALTPFKARITATPSSGALTYSGGNFEETMAIVSASFTNDDSEKQDIPIVAEEEFYYRHTSRIHRVSEAFPILQITSYDSGVSISAEVAPAAVTADITLDILKRPTKPSKSTSTDLDWKEPQINEIMNEAIRILSTNTQNTLAGQFGTQQVISGS